MDSCWWIEVINSNKEPKESAHKTCVGASSREWMVDLCSHVKYLVAHQQNKYINGRTAAVCKQASIRNPFRSIFSSVSCSQAPSRIVKRLKKSKLKVHLEWSLENWHCMNKLPFSIGTRSITELSVACVTWNSKPKGMITDYIENIAHH